MYVLDQTLAAAYHAADLRNEARRAALARQLAPSPLRQLARRLGR